MPDLDITGSVTRTELALSDLSLNTATYKIFEWGPGSVAMRKQKASTPYVHGDFATAIVKEQTETPLGIRVTGSSYVDCWNKMSDLLRAFEQFSYILTLDIEGTVFEYLCEAADYSVGEGGFFQNFHFMAYKQEVRFLIPRRPNPTQGPV